MTPIHFTYRENGLDNTRYVIACQPGVTNLMHTADHPIFQRTGDPRAVTCPMCKQTVIFKQRHSEQDSLLRRHGLA